MIDRSFLRKIAAVNSLKVNRHAKKLLRELKKPVSEIQIHVLQLLDWAEESGKLIPADRLEPAILMVNDRETDPMVTARFLDLANMPLLDDPVEMAREVLEQINGKMQENGIVL
jgi:hypothetical protein